MCDFKQLRVKQGGDVNYGTYFKLIYCVYDSLGGDAFRALFSFYKCTTITQVRIYLILDVCLTNNCNATK